MLRSRVCLAHGFRRAQFDAMSVMHHPIKDGIGDAPTAEVFVPVAYGQL
jgi:hypothetical protein